MTETSMTQDAKDSVDMTTVRTESAMSTFEERQSRRAGGAQITDGVFVAPVAERANSAALLPAHVERPGAVVINSREAMSLSELSSRLTAATDIPHILSLGPSGGGSDAQPSGGAGLTSRAGGDFSVLPDVPPEDPAEENANAPTSGRGNGISSSDSGTRQIQLSLKGTLSEVLDKVSAHYEVEWSYQDGKIIFRDYVSRQYQISSIPSTTSGGTTVGGASSTYTTDFWAEIESSVKGILGDDVVYSIGQSTGLMSVTAKVADHAKIEDYIDEINKALSQQIAFDVNVLSVTLSEDDGRSLDLGLALDDAGNKFNYKNKVGSISGGSSMNVKIVEGILDFDAMMSALSEQGRVAIDTRTGVTTMNNRPVPVEVIDTISYIASVTSEETDGGTSRLVPTPGTQDTGFSLQIFPRIMNDRQIMVEYSVKLSELKALKEFGENETMVQLPEVSSTSFSQQAVLENNQTLVLAGFERTRINYDADVMNRLGGAFGVGGSRKAKEERVATVMMIKPRILKAHKAITSGSE
jgi:type II secretory pathway component GspD/PulD (secretin)